MISARSRYGLRAWGRRARRGGGVVVFAAILFPAAIYGLAVTADHGRVVLAARQAGDLADTVAMAAASTRTANGDTIEVFSSRRIATETFNYAITAGMLSPAVNAELRADEITYSSDRTSVTVKVRWHVGSPPLIEFFFPDFQGIHGSATRTTKVCDTETSGRPCAYPL